MTEAVMWVPGSLYESEAYLSHRTAQIQSTQRKDPSLVAFEHCGNLM